MYLAVKKYLKPKMVELCCKLFAAFAEKIKIHLKPGKLNVPTPSGGQLFTPGSFGVPNLSAKMMKAFLKSAPHSKGLLDLGKNLLKNYYGGAVDIHKTIGKLPKPKAGWTPSKYKYMGPYNPLDKQLKYDPNTGKVLKWYVQPYNKVDEMAAHHDICYDIWEKIKVIVIERWFNH